MPSVRRLAFYYLNYPSGFSIVRDVFGYPEPPRTLSLRERLRFLESFADERVALIQAWIDNWRAEGFGPPIGSADPRTYKPHHEFTFRRIAAGLMALKDIAHFGEPYDSAPNSKEFPGDVETWIVEHFRVVAFMGSTEEWWKKDEEKPDFTHDMVMKEVVSLLYTFRDDRHLLTDNACYALVDKGLKDFLDEEFGKHLTFTFLVPWWVQSLFIAYLISGPVGFIGVSSGLGTFGSVALAFGAIFIVAVANGLTYPETENHVLMAYTSIHLARQWVKRNYRDDPRLEEGPYANVEDGGLDDQIDDLLLQAAGRVVHSGFFETNGRPYLPFSIHALSNLHTYSERDELRVAAGNALDYAYANFAFRSWQGRKGNSPRADGRSGTITVGPSYGPFRRNNKGAEDVSIYGTAEISMIVLLGEPPWDSAYWSTHLGNPGGFALWSMLLRYRPHEIITDLALKENLFASGRGYWARMQSRFTSTHYREGERPGYFASDGRIFAEDANIHSTPEACLATPEFMNAGGGRFDRYEVAYDDAISGFRGSPLGTHEYDFIARPQVAFVQQTFHDFVSDADDADRANAEKQNQMRQSMLFMFGHRDFWLSDNSGIYKGFSYGYFKAGDRDDRHSDFPMNIPPAWIDRRLEEDGSHVLRNSSASRVVFTFYDLGTSGSRGPYVITGRASKTRDRRRYRAYARGFWELVPSGRFATVSDLKDWVLEHNPDEQFSNTTEGERRHYLYTMTTGETLQLNDLLGHGWSERQNRWDEVTNPIRKIWASGSQPLVDEPLRLVDVLFNHERASEVNALPLLDVAEVGDTLAFTGRRFAEARGDGRLRITNPFLNYELLIDSRDYRHPTREGRILQE
jgi:hypothetical protein